MSRSLSTSPAASQQGGMTDAPFDSLIDYSGYDNTARSESPSLSPGASKALFAPSSIKTESSTAGQMVPAPQQQMSGPSHQYDLYKQQTGIVPGALATTLAVNLTAEVQGYTNFNLDFLGSNDVFDFNCFPSQASMSTPSLDNMDFEASPTGDFFFGEPTVNPNSVGGQEPHSLSPPPALAAQTSNVGRMWPGMHKQAALAKAQAQQEQQQQIIQQQRHQRQRSVVSQCQAKTAHRNLSAQPSDPLVEQKITQLLNSMRGKASDDDAANMPHLNMARSRKDEDDMDEDERLLASEEGKKLSSKERRQLRNKVSARAFRSRRKGVFLRHSNARPSC